MPPPQPGQKPQSILFPTAYLGSRLIEVVSRGDNEHYELIGSTLNFNGVDNIIKVIDSQLIPGFNSDIPLQPNVVKTLPARVVKMSECERHNNVLQALRKKQNRTPIEDMQVYQALAYLDSLDVMWMTGYLLKMVAENSGLTNLTPDNRNLVVAVCNIAKMDNAYCWAGTIFIGNGETYFTPLGVPDVFGHEWMHAWVDRTCKLVYQGESGALNEHIADTGGTFFEYDLDQAFNKDADPSNDLPFSFDLLVGLQCGKEMRYMRNFEHPEDVIPPAQPQPSVYQGKFWGDPNAAADYGFVHGNSGVGNGMAANILKQIGYTLGKKLFFSTWKRLKPNSGYIDYRDRLTEVAAELGCLEPVKKALITAGLTDNIVSTWVPTRD